MFTTVRLRFPGLAGRVSVSEIMQHFLSRGLPPLAVFSQRMPVEATSCQTSPLLHPAGTPHTLAHTHTHTSTTFLSTLHIGCDPSASTSWVFFLFLFFFPNTKVPLHGSFASCQILLGLLEPSVSCSGDAPFPA